MFHNVCGYFATLKSLAQEIHDPSTNSSLKSRLATELENVKTELKNLKLGAGFAEEVKEELKNLKTTI